MLRHRLNINIQMCLSGLGDKISNMGYVKQNTEA